MNNSDANYITERDEQQSEAQHDNDKAEAIRKIIADSKPPIVKLATGTDWKECRHIELETFAAFEAGYLSRFIHPSAPNTMPTPRFIFPLGDANDPPSFNAILSPSGRERFKNSDRWEHKNKCLTAGQKLLFNPSALKEKIVVVVEGEFDCVSLWQSNHKSKEPLDTGSFDRVGFCALGGAGIFNDLIKRLSAMEVKPKIIILFDKDKDAEGNDGAGIIDGRKLKDELLAMHVLCSVQFFEDVLTDDEKEYIGKKCDANAILCSKGEDFLFWRLNRLVKRAVADFKQLEDEFARAKEYEQEQSGKSPLDDYVPPPARKQSSTAGGHFSDEAKRAAIEKLADDIINTVTAEMLEQKGIITHSARGAARPNGYACNLCGSGTKHEKTGGLNFTPSAPTAFYCQACHESGNVIQFLSKVWNIDNHGKSYFELIQKIADTFGFSYDPSIFEPPRSRRARLFSDITTKDKIADCPVDLILPRDVLFNDEGITLVESRGQNNPPRYVTAAETPIVPTKIFRDDKTGLVQYELAILTQGEWRHHIVDGRTIQSPRCVDKLANFGALIKPSPLCEYFTRIIAANGDRLKTWKIFAQPGWKDEKFQHFIYPTGGTDYIVDRAGYNYSADYAKRGNADKWKKLFSVAMEAGGRIARIFCGVAVAAPLIRPLKITNMQAHLFGGVNSGKTVLARLIASIFGNPQELLRTFESSPKRRQADAAANNDMPTIYDELETVRGQRAEMSLTQSVYGFFNGKGNQNLNVDGTARDTFNFTGSRLSTGERQILKVADQFGAYKRLVPLECREKIFDKELATLIYRFTADNFGHFGREWTAYIAEHLSAIRERYEAKEREILANDKYEETQLRTICAAGVAYQFFAQFLKLQDEFNGRIFLDDATGTIEELPTVEESSDSARAIDVVKDVVASNEDRFYIETNNANAPRLHEFEPKANGEHFGKLYLDGAVAIYPTTLSNILAKAGFASPEMLIRTWNDEGKLITNEGRNTRRMRIGDSNNRTIFFKAGILSEGRDGYIPEPPT